MAEGTTFLYEQNKLERTAGRIEGTIQTVNRLRHYLPPDIRRKLTNRAIAAQTIINEKIAEEDLKGDRISEKIDRMIKKLGG